LKALASHVSALGSIYEPTNVLDADYLTQMMLRLLPRIANSVPTASEAYHPR
jgi:hypothetical protein